jgi:hypothetical protein
MSSCSLYSTIQKQCLIQKGTFRNVKNDMKMFKIKAMHHNIIVIQVLDRVYNGHISAFWFWYPSPDGSYINLKPGMWHYIPSQAPDLLHVIWLKIYCNKIVIVVLNKITKNMRYIDKLRDNNNVFICDSQKQLLWMLLFFIFVVFDCYKNEKTFFWFLCTWMSSLYQIRK